MSKKNVKLGKNSGNTKFAKVNNYLSNTAKMGKNVKIWHFVYVEDKIIISHDNIKIGSSSVSDIDYNVKIGNNTRIEGPIYISSLSVIGNNVFIGPSATFTNDLYPVSPKQYR